ncbi:cytochrome P450 [Streptomyces sp. GQFP]|uniref:cytochrome P450 n=1 Tax=Streptomyces sp. GQFP TaxID=2907545 RepID=UPI001F2314D0|nr:cytochrome P450 [Streptomyces sp. GQFP]UIX29370.1 cytochrome P450 [Streptomyces sp. GQFP]
MDETARQVGPVPAVTTHFDPLEPALAAEFWPRINALRESCPVAWSDQVWHERGDSGFWIINKHADVMAAATNPTAFSSADGATPVQFDLDVLRQLPLESDPPLHRGIRRLLNPFFTPEALRGRETDIAAKVDRLIGRCVDKGSCDFVADFVNVLPPLVFFESFLEQDESEIGWVLDVLEVLHTQPERALEEAPKLFAFCADLLERRRAAGRRDDLAGTIAHMGLTGEDGLELNEKQRVEVINLMIMAGMATTMGATGCFAYRLASDEQLRAGLRGADDRRINRAVEEFLRYETAVPTGARTLTEDVEMSGCPMKAGDRVLLNWAAANRDPEKFAEPDELDFERENLSGHVAFGAGIHRCLGNHLARREMSATLKAIVALSRFEVEPGFVPRYQPSFARGLDSLPVRIAR